MTQVQQDAVNAAQKKFFDAEAAATATQAVYTAQEADFEAARTNALVTIPAENQQRLVAAQNVYMQKLASLPALQQIAADAWTAVGTAKAAYQQAINDSLNTGAQEQVPPSHPFTGTVQA